VTPERTAATVDALMADFDILAGRMAAWHRTDFLGIDVTMSQAKLLYLASLKPQTGMSALAHDLGVSLPTMTGLVDRLVEHGLVQRRDDPADRRTVTVALTPDGWASLERFREIPARRLRAIVERLRPDELHHLALGIRALRAHLDDLPADPVEPHPGPLPAAADPASERTSR
jgi:DNA-binding MarR family transcriptional regulator